MDYSRINSHYRLHGDNIVECERIMKIIIEAHGKGCDFVGPNGNPATPSFLLKESDKIFKFTYFPGFKRWDNNILDLITSYKGTLREAVDVIITRVKDGYEEPLIAIEYSSALPAGNNAWQRSGRAYSFVKAGIPYFYLIDIGGFELDKNRNRKSRRYANQAVPFSYLTYSYYENCSAIPVFEPNPDVDSKYSNYFKPVFGDHDFKDLLYNLIHGLPTDDIETKLKNKLLLFVDLLYNKPDKKPIKKKLRDWSTSYQNIKQGKTLIDCFNEEKKISWKKKVSIPTTPTMKKLLESSALLGTGVTRESLPFCMMHHEKRKAFANQLSNIYNDIPPKLKYWLSQEKNLVICWIAGFKPGGDDSRPDRGLVPFARMLFDRDTHILSVVYGPGKTEMWQRFHRDPNSLMDRNGLWEAILKLSDAIVIDSKTSLENTERGYLSDHWNQGPQNNNQINIIPSVSETPVSFGENDVDTVLHNIFSYALTDCSFEGMCNPPGGDWSGISILDPSKKTEYRWLTLPRVSGEKTKRPDHVFQIFSINAQPLILTIESKETAISVENGIGPRLSNYLRNLFSYTPNVERNFPSGLWRRSQTKNPHKNMIMITAIAYRVSNSNELESTISRARCDLAFAVQFKDKWNYCEIKIKSNSAYGEKVLNLLNNKLSSNEGLYRLRLENSESKFEQIKLP